jgi:serine/threonine protein kinase/class 3 adenylate cyclase
MDEQDLTIDRLLKNRAELDKELQHHRVTLTILFTDVVGSTAYYERYGDTAGLAMAYRHEDLCRRSICEFAGRVIKTIGDAIMAEFADPGSGVRCAAEIQRRLFDVNQAVSEHDRMQLRIGLHHGTCFRRGTDVYGDAVNLASRIAHRSGPAQILTSSTVHLAVSSNPEFRFVRLGEEAFKGKEEKEEVFEVVWTDLQTYSEIRQSTTAALARGELISVETSLAGLVGNSAEPLAQPVRRQPGEGVGALAGSRITTRYEILGEIGSGGMGVVYRARDRETAEIVALKVIRPEFVSDNTLVERFRNELRLARRITHRNVCRIHEFNRADSLAYISMEYVDGDSLRQILGRFGGLPIRKGLQIARQLCAGLQEAHGQGIVHRDLKPENIMVDRSGNVKIMDFGIARTLGARTTLTGMIVGTPAYMAPEQAEGKTVDQRTDIYAVGLTLYEVFTGTPTFIADTPIAVAIKHLREDPRPPREVDPSIPEGIEEVILKCLAKNPDDRFQSVGELDAALVEGFARGVTSQTPFRPSGGHTSLPQPSPAMRSATSHAPDSAVLWNASATTGPTTAQPPIPQATLPGSLGFAWRWILPIAVLVLAGIIGIKLLLPGAWLPQPWGVPVTSNDTNTPLPTDPTIISAIEAKFFDTPEMRRGTIHVSSINGVVTLHGVVTHVDMKVLAEALARQVSGVKEVLNQLAVATDNTQITGPKVGSYPVHTESLPRVKSVPNETTNTHPVEQKVSTPPPPQTLQVTIPEGTLIRVQLVDSIASDNAGGGKVFHALVDTPVTTEGRLLIPRGSVAGVQVVSPFHSPSFFSPQQIQLRMDAISTATSTYNIQSDVQTVIGQVNSNTNGPPIVLSKKFSLPTRQGPAAVIPAGTLVDFHLSKPLIVTLSPPGP